MLKLIFGKILSAVPTLLSLVILVFFLVRMAPGGPFDSEVRWPPEIQQNIEAKFGLNLPLYSQFWIWIKDVFTGNLRESFHYLGKPVLEILQESFPVSFYIGAAALGLAVFFGVFFGCISAWKKDSWLDSTVLFFSISGMSLPSYLLASVLILFFALRLGWFPPALWEEPKSLILPIITLACRPTAMIARLTRTSVIETLRQPFVRTARAQGASPSRLIFKSALKVSLIPVVTLLGPLTANLITGSFVVEYIFQLPGMGRYFVSAVLNRDYPLIMGVTLVYGIFLITCNLAVDLAYTWVDPRIRFGKNK